LLVKSLKELLLAADEIDAEKQNAFSPQLDYLMALHMFAKCDPGLVVDIVDSLRPYVAEVSLQ
jgi:hypothetical protein